VHLKNRTEGERVFIGATRIEDRRVVAAVEICNGREEGSSSHGLGFVVEVRFDTERDVRELRIFGFVVALRELEVLRYVTYLYLEGAPKRLKASASVKVKSKRQPIYLRTPQEICRRFPSFTGDFTFPGEPVLNRRRTRDSPRMASTATPNISIPKHLSTWLSSRNIVVFALLNMLLIRLRKVMARVQDASNLRH
jgi:hypothetical protein